MQNYPIFLAQALLILPTQQLFLERKIPDTLLSFVGVFFLVFHRKIQGLLIPSMYRARYHLV